MDDERQNWLINEIHHRVKNNLQIIVSLLNSQSVSLTDDAAMDAITKSKGRVESISFIHQKMYKTTNYSSINMPEYIQNLIDYLRNSFEGDQLISFHLNIASVLPDVGDAVPIGLIINKGVTNSIKYAFLQNDRGRQIEISLQKESKYMLLIIRDNGKGFTETQDDESNSFGLILMNELARQLNEKFERINSDGTDIQITFKPATALYLINRWQIVGN